MFLMWIVPLLLIGLVVYTISSNNNVNFLKPIASHICPQCNQAVQSDWKNCPHCGQTS